IAQAIDYASCLHRVDPAWLRKQCDGYLQSKGGSQTLDALLEQRGRSLDAEADGREVVIYLVGTGHDPALERMVGYLADQADLALRIVTFSAFRDSLGRLLLAREIHEIDEVASAASRRPTASTPPPESILALADR